MLADISGYTPFLAGTELEHAQAIISDLLNLIIGHLTPTLELAEVEGDAVFSYAPESRIMRGETLLELIETTYVGFRDRRLSMSVHTSCGCRACQAIPTLDLKFVTHYGEYVLQGLAGKNKPIGSDVNLSHRLLKNNVSSTTGWHAYALFTHKTLETMDVRPDGLHEQVESYEHLGAVLTKSLNLHDRYDELKQKKPVSITPEDADVSLFHEYAAPPPVVWEWLNDPMKRNRWMAGTEWSVVTRPGGRTQAGATNHCLHGKESTIENILDWKPFEYCSAEYLGTPVRLMMAYQLEATEKGTRLGCLVKIKSRLPRWLIRPACRFLVSKVLKTKDDLVKLGTLIAAHS